MAIILNGTTGITTPDIDSTAGFDGEDLTGDVAAARITGALNAAGSAPIYAGRAWVNFNGTGAVAIRASGNVSSITDNGAGDYTVNFTTAMPDADYAVSISAREQNSTAGSALIGGFPNQAVSTIMQTTGVRVAGKVSGGNTLADAALVTVAVFR